THLGIGITQYDTPCWRQFGATCYLSRNTTKFCINADVKNEGLTDYGRQSISPEFWCGFDHTAQHRDGAWKWGRYMPEQYRKCSGVIYNNIAMTVNAKKRRDTRYPKDTTICSFSEWHDPEDIKAIQEKNANTLMLVSGVVGKDWESVVESPRKTEVFVSSCVDLMKKHKFKGIIIDWIGPESSRVGGPSPSFTKIAEAFSKVMGEKKQRIFGAMVDTRYPANTHYDIANTHVYFDKIFMKTYDLYGPTNPHGRRCHTAWDLGSNCGIGDFECKQRNQYHYLKYAVNYFQTHVPVDKLSFGLAFFGTVLERDGNKFKAPKKALSLQLKTVGKMGYAVMVAGRDPRFKCTMNERQQCCQTVFEEGGITYYASWDTESTHLEKIKRAFEEYRITSFFSNSMDMELASEPFEHDKLSTYISNLGTVPAQKTALPVPSYQIGTGPFTVCPGIIATMGKLVFTQIPYAQFTKLTSFSELYAANVELLYECVPGDPTSTTKSVAKPPEGAVAL
ncbi:glycoprotein, partial [Salmonid herpesvirus 3]